jgi:hypothetical protein
LSGITNPTWSPDGSRIAFTGLSAGVSNLFVVNVDGTGLRRLTDGRAAALHPSWSPDGKSIAYVTDIGPLSNFSELHAGPLAIALYDLATGEPRWVGPAGGESYSESATIAPGAGVVVTDLPWGRLGLSVCYDLRFPQLYRSLAQAGADFLSVPAAFTKTTGRAHWHVLLRARAIETGCYVFAPCQYGVHAGGRAVYGHSLIIDPWGKVLADGGEDRGFIMAEVDPAAVAKARSMIPALEHDRPFELAEPDPPRRAVGQE